MRGGREEVCRGISVKYSHSNLGMLKKFINADTVDSDVTGGRDVKKRLKSMRYIWSIMTWPEKPQYNWNLMNMTM